MNYEKWIKENCGSLEGKTVAVTGTTGGLGKELCGFLASLGATLILVDRNAEKSNSFANELKNKYSCSAECITADLEDMDSVKTAATVLLGKPIDIFIHNAGAYSIPRKICKTGYDNVFQINFVSPYYIIKTLLPKLRERRGKAVAVGSIAHNYSKTDSHDIDFSTRKQASMVYGNAKRYLMFSLTKLFENEQEASLSIVHPGISFTGITNHYPKLIFAVIKHPMKVIFMKPKKAGLSILKGCFDETAYSQWIGPRFFDVWGIPKIKMLKTAKEDEIKSIFSNAEKIYYELKR